MELELEMVEVESLRISAALQLAEAEVEVVLSILVGRLAQRLQAVGQVQIGQLMAVAALAIQAVEAAVEMQVILKQVATAAQES